MPKKAKVYLAVAALIAAAAVPATLLPARTAGASTTACGSACTSPSVQSLGTGEVLTVSGGNVVMATASTTSTGQDWTPEQEGQVSMAVSAGVVSPRLDMQYSGDTLVEYQYAPAGVPSDQCLADGVITPFDQAEQPSMTVVLAPCGFAASTLWIIDAANEGNGYVDLINAGYANGATNYYYPPPFGTSTGPTGSYQSNYAEPAVLAVNSSGRVVLAFLSELGGVVSPSQLWTAWSAPAQPALRRAVANSRPLPAGALPVPGRPA